MAKGISLKIFSIIITLFFFNIGCTKIDVYSQRHHESIIENADCTPPENIELTSDPIVSPYIVLAELKLVESIEKGAIELKRNDDQLFRNLRIEAGKYCADAVIQIRFSSAADPLRNKKTQKQIFVSDGYTQKYIITGKAIKWKR